MGDRRPADIGAAVGGIAPTASQVRNWLTGEPMTEIPKAASLRNVAELNGFSALGLLLSAGVSAGIIDADTLDSAIWEFIPEGKASLFPDQLVAVEKFIAAQVRDARRRILAEDLEEQVAELQAANAILEKKLAAATRRADATRK